jgi:hypothetical protein
MDKHSLLIYLLFNFPLSIFIGLVGRKFPIGFWHAFMLSMILSGVIGIYITVLYGSTKEELADAAKAADAADD